MHLLKALVARLVGLVGDVEKEGERGAGGRVRSSKAALRRGRFCLVMCRKASISPLFFLGKSQGKGD